MLYGDPADNAITEEIIRCAIEVHRELGPGLLEAGALLSEHRPDLIAGERVVVEVKSIERFDRIHIAQLLTYLRITGLKVGLLLNFNSAFIRQGIRRVML